MRSFLKHFAVLLLPAFSFAQKIDNTASFRNIGSDHYFRFNYDNDYFASLDEYYSQGYSFELVSSQLRKNPANHIFFLPRSNTFKFGLALEHIAFTPTSILSDEILYGDRPFAAAIMLKSFAIATNTPRHSRLVSSINIGIIGPGAFGNEMQTAIHRWTGNPEPHGWQHQIRNDIVLNYELSYEKQLLRIGNVFSLQANAAGRFGTLYTNVSGGLNAAFGLINDPFSNTDSRKFKCYFYIQPVATAVGYDATLQGGLFNRESPYTISDKSVERFTTQNTYGFVLNYRSLYLEYTRTMLTREFDTGKPHKWGGIRVGFKL